MMDDQEGDQVSLQERLEEAEGNNDGDLEQEQVRGSGRDQADGGGGGKMQEPHLEGKAKESQTRL